MAVRKARTSDQGATVTFFAGSHFEVSGSTITKYYYAGAQRIAMRKDGALNYILSDHLGSTSAILDETGTLINQQCYSIPFGDLPFGQPRADVPTPFVAPTDFGYTGQRLLDPGLGGLMDYKARFYSPYLNRFIQPDTLIPGAGNPQAWNRYAYVLNSPVRYNDPSGHGHECGMQIGECKNDSYYAGFYTSHLSPKSRAIVHELMDPKHYLESAVPGLVLYGSYVFGPVVGDIPAVMELLRKYILSTIKSQFFIPVLRNAFLTGITNTALYFILDDNPTFAGGVGAFTTGAVAGATGTISAPLAKGSLLGTSIINGLGGAIGYGAGDYVQYSVDTVMGNEGSPEATLAGYVMNFALPAVLTPVITKAFPVRSMNSIPQARCFIPGRTWHTAGNVGNLEAQNIMSIFFGSLYADRLLP